MTVASIPVPVRWISRGPNALASWVAEMAKESRDGF
jgi:hypothetical protein